MPSYLAPICYSCSKFKGKGVCSAYPNGIPRDIYFKGGKCGKSSIQKASKSKSKTKKKRK